MFYQFKPLRWKTLQSQILWHTTQVSLQAEAYGREQRAYCKLVAFWQNRPLTWSEGIFLFWGGGEAASQIYHAAFSYPWRHSPLDVEQVLNSFAIIIYIIRLSILSYCSLLIRLSPMLGYNLKSSQMFRSFIRFAAARLNASFMDFIHLQC